MGGIRWDARAAESPTQPSSRRAPVACVAALGAPGVITSGPTPGQGAVDLPGSGHMVRARSLAVTAGRDGPAAAGRVGTMHAPYVLRSLLVRPGTVQRQSALVETWWSEVLGVYTPPGCGTRSGAAQCL